MALIQSGYAFAAVYGLGFFISLLTKQHHWSVARITTFLGLLASIALPVIDAFNSQTALPHMTIVMGILVALLGWVIVDYASRYLEGDTGQPRFVRAMLATLFAVALLVKSDNLLVMAVAWSATSFSLHFLLTHYKERKAGQIVAHKKFIASRLADICLIIALFLSYHSFGTFSLSSIGQQLQAFNELPVLLGVATCLFALAAILKTAQLPLHGWLIQVMEAPTPVSALLHAGVVNMGGFVLISLAPLLDMAPKVQAMLVVFGGMTALLAGWVMMTRISIKVRLAWSTCAQMGFMLLEIGLGLYELALLHLVAHSVYKAYSFLSAGDIVQQTVNKDYLPQSASVKGTVLGVIITGVIIMGTLWVWQQWLPSMTLPTAAIVILVFGFSTLLWHSPSASVTSVLVGVFRVVVLLHVYLLWHTGFAQITSANEQTSVGLLIFVCAVFTLLYAGQVAICRYPRTRAVKIFYPWVYNGFYLDETFTRLTFKVWPIQLSVEQAQTKVNRSKTINGERA
ncbi:NADH-quinone oxidoreductase subunit L [Pseudoalteromonas sp. SSDWG2]|uniref:NADH-quinone oxidoreductase subunit L n=1 Tax=Pseudoalteromonas sp. SSDWG2 TaxID=3139391 RepID=UPI003BA8C216